MQSHVEFQVVTPRTLASFNGDALILPDVRCLGAAELGTLKSYAASGKTLVVTGQTGRYDETGAEVKANPVHQLLGITDPAQKKAATSPRKLVYFPNDPGRGVFRRHAEGVQPAGRRRHLRTRRQFNTLRKAFVEEVVRVSGYKPAVEVEASPFLSSQVASVGGATARLPGQFQGLEIQRERRSRSRKRTSRSSSTATAGAMPTCCRTWARCSKLEGEWKNGTLTCVIPEIGKGAVVWMEQFGFGEGDPNLP